MATQTVNEQLRERNARHQEMLAHMDALRTKHKTHLIPDEIRAKVAELLLADMHQQAELMIEALDTLRLLTARMVQFHESFNKANYALLLFYTWDEYATLWERFYPADVDPVSESSEPSP